MKYKNRILIGLSILGLTWYFYPSEYDRIMSKALEEQRKHPEIKMFDGELEPPMPEKSKNNETLLGVDSNKNGVRDDIEIWINRMALDNNERKGMKQYARALQKSFKYCLETPGSDASIVVSNESTASICLSFVSEHKRKKHKYDRKSLDISDTLNTLSNSNNSRNNCLWSFNSAPFKGTQKDNVWHKNCDFEIENLNTELLSHEKFRKRE